MSEDYSSVDRLGADVGPGYFRCVIVRRPNARCLGTTGEIVGKSHSLFVSVSDAEEREHTCPFEEYVRRSTGEIVKTSHRVISAGLSGLIRGDRVSSVCLTPKTETQLSY